MFGVLSAIVAYVTIAYQCSRIGSETAQNKKKAKAESLDYYYGADNKMRAMSTGEIVTMVYEDEERKLIGVHTGRVYKNFTQEKTDKFIMETNQKLFKGGTRVVHKRCPRYWDPYKRRYCDTHLYEISSGRPYKVLLPHVLIPGHSPDTTRFTIVYLDENKKMDLLSEYSYIPKEYYWNYKLGLPINS